MTEQVVVRVPASAAYADLLRTAAAGVGAVVDLSLDDLHDLRTAVGEAAVLVIGCALSGTAVEGRFTIRNGGVAVEIHAESAAEVDVDRTSFGWQVLAALTERPDSQRTHDGTTVSFALPRTDAHGPDADGTGPS